MNDGRPAPVLRHLRRLVQENEAGRASDRELLERFATGHEEFAFAELLQRHGAMVLGVCRRVLHDHHEAEDAFQATFLILTR
jgi:RNA polymerase sigma-70 factor (ECF subfamily)